jgi:hypothetical protein
MTINWQTAANVATALALLVATGVFIWQIIYHRKEKAYTNSHFALQSALESYDQAVDVLADENNDRVTWITAARIVERANQISKNITEQVHKDVLEVQLERYRRQMADILGFDNPNKGAWFFYGIKNFSADIDTAAKESTRPVKTAFGSKGQTRYISESSLATLYTIAGYPTNYEDPLKKESLVGKVGVEMRASFPGLFEYLTHRSEYKTVNGNLVKRGQRDDP